MHSVPLEQVLGPGVEFWKRLRVSATVRTRRDTDTQSRKQEPLTVVQMTFGKLTHLVTVSPLTPQLSRPSVSAFQGRAVSTF